MNFQDTKDVLEPANIQAWNNNGNALRNLAKRDEAAKAYDISY
jgi:hypothetical protein